MLKLIITTTLICLGFEVFVNAQSDSSWHDQSHIVHGIYYGTSPIYRNDFPKSYLFVESENKLTLKDIPIDLKFRISNEKFHYGKENYFKLSYNAARYRGILKNKYLVQLNELYKLITLNQNQLNKYEANLAFAQYKNKGQSSINKLTTDSLNLKGRYNLPDMNVPNIPDKFMPEIDTSINKPKFEVFDFKNQKNTDFQNTDKLRDTINTIQERINFYKESYHDIQQKHQKLNQHKGTDLLSNFKTIDIGLTGLNTSGSGSTIPVQGINVRYEEDNYFIETSAGFTLPNQILTTNVYQQVAYNEANVFNSGSNSSFNIKSTKFLARTNVGYGKLNGDNIAVETFYNSRVLKFRKDDTLYNVTLKDKLTSNITGRLAVLSKNNLVLSGSIGATWLDKNTSELNLKESFGGSAQGEYSIINQKVKASYRYMAPNYDSWVQGVFLAQNERIELSHQSKIGNKWNFRYHYARNRYFSGDIFGGTSSNEYGVNTGYYGRKFGFNAGYSILQMLDRNSTEIINNNLNHMTNMSLFINKDMKNNSRYSFNADNNSLFLTSRDTVLKVLSSSISNRFSFGIIALGLTLKHQYYEGLNDIHGHFFIVQPELKLRVRDFYFRGFLAISKSEQYNWTYGGSGEVGFRFDKYLSWSIEAQKFLKNEYILFRNLPEDVNPYILKLKMIIDI